MLSLGPKSYKHTSRVIWTNRQLNPSAECFMMSTFWHSSQKSALDLSNSKSTENDLGKCNVSIITRLFMITRLVMITIMMMMITTLASLGWVLP